MVKKLLSGTAIALVVLALMLSNNLTGFFGIDSQGQVPSVFADSDDSSSDDDDGMWYVQGQAVSDPDEDGSKEHPFDSLADVEAASAPGDQIVVLVNQDGIVLDGGITLKDGQRLIGETADGDDDSDSDDDETASVLPQITNSSGDGVTLADDNEVSNLHILDTDRSGIIGIDVSGATIRSNLITGFNISQHQTPDVRDNTYAGIFFLTSASGTNDISDNVIKEANSSAITFAATGTSVSDVNIEGNLISHIGRYLDKAKPVYVRASDDSFVNLEVLDLEIANIKARGFHEEPLYVVAGESARMDVLVDGYYYHDNGIDPFPDPPCCTMGDYSGALEFAIPDDSDGAVLNATVQNSTILDTPGIEGGGFAALEFINLGDSSVFNVTVRDSIIKDANSRGIWYSNGSQSVGGSSTVIESRGGYVNRCVNNIRRRPSLSLIQWRFHPHTVHLDRRLGSTQGPSDA